MSRGRDGLFHLKLADFGFTTTGLPSRIYDSLERRGSTPYFAPEVILHHNFSAKSDVWAYGCVLYELLLCCDDWSRPFPSEEEIRDYYSDARMMTPHVDWMSLGIHPWTIPDAFTRSWDIFNGVFRMTFNRDAARRPDAGTVRERKESWMEGNPVDA
jgi:serine/threonine protein kinase